MTGLDIAVFAGFAIAMLLIAGLGATQFLVGLVLTAYFVFPRIVVGDVADAGYFVGISWSHPVLLTCHVAILSATVYLVARRDVVNYSFLLPIVPLMLFAAVFYLFVWSPSDPLSAGLVHLLTLGGSWAVGAVLFAVLRSAPGGFLIMAKWLAGVAVFIALVCSLQVIGLDLYGNSGKSLRSFAGDRVVGTFNEPTAAGKFLFLLLVLSLFWIYGRSRMRFYTIILVSCGLIVSMLTQTRSNFAAIGGMLLLYSLAVNRRNRLVQLSLAAFALILAGFISYSTWDARFSEEGGIRMHTVEIAVEYMQSRYYNWLTGIGPNRYFEVFAPIDSWVARGYPAHNYIVYLIVELGLIGTLLYLLPIVALTIRSFRTVRLKLYSAPYGRAWLCALPGLILIATFGWGMLSVAAPALFLVMGYLYVAMGDGDRNLYEPLNSADQLEGYEARVEGGASASFK